MDKDQIFFELKSILAKYESKLTVLHNKNDNYYLNIPTTAKKEEFFGAVQIKKSYVAFHLMPIYYYPELLDGVSQELKNKMQGKSCFNFNDKNDKLFAALSTLTATAFDKYKSLNKVQ
jgi:hypothetical protein